MALRTLGLFAGTGGLELGLELAFGCRTVCYVERDAYAAATLVARMEDQTLAAAPIWDDITTFDGSQWRGAVDCIAGGFPCQDISVAGKGAGLDGARSGLWSEYARIIREVRPRFVFVENVSALASRGLNRVLGDLAEAGFDAEWGCFRASDIGAPHRRERLFALAWRVSGTECCAVQEEPRRGGWCGDGACAAESGYVGATVANSNSNRLQGRQQAPPAARPIERGSRAVVADPDVRATWPPGPTDTDGWLDYIAAGGPEPALRRIADGAADQLVDRTDRLRCLGNGVVPLQAAYAFRALAARAGIEAE